jgi:hypothetical protein
MGRQKTHIRNRKAPWCERRKSSTRIAVQSDGSYTDQYGRVLVWSEKHRTYVPSGSCGTAAVNSPKYKKNP